MHDDASPSVSLAIQADLLRPGVLGTDLEPVFAHFREHGYARIDGVATEACLKALRQRVDDLMMGRIVHEGLFFQHDATSGRYEDLAYGQGWEGPSLAYRKVEKLEKDPLFRAWLANPLFERIATELVGPEVSLYRAMVMSKSKEGGSDLPWHQDGGLFWGIDRDPHLQLWTALDDAPVEGGCVEVVPGSHHGGLVTRAGGLVPKAALLAHPPEPRRVLLPARAGDVLLLHNHVWHRSGLSHTGHPRRAFSVCYMDAATQCLRKRSAPRTFFRVFG